MIGRHLLDVERYVYKSDLTGTVETTLLTTRGCPIGCTFCSCSQMFGKNYTMRSAKRVVDEIEYCIDKYKVNGVRFFDSTFTLNRRHVLEFINELKARQLKISWTCEVRVDTVDMDLLRAMKEAGCYYIDFGAESASDAVLKRIKKRMQ